MIQARSPKLNPKTYFEPQLANLTLSCSTVWQHYVSRFLKRDHFAPAIFERMPEIKWLLLSQMFLKISIQHILRS